MRRTSLEANLMGAAFGGADLTGANLTKAALGDADLPGVSLFGANLSGADLTSVSLLQANLDGVDLAGADLFNTDFRQAYLRGTNFTRARMGMTILDAVDLSTVRGLETVQHDTGSTTGIDTLYRSNGPIPEAFLRGAGVPEEIITYAKSLVGRPFEFYSCFIN